jgi:hypothetical protein
VRPSKLPPVNVTDQVLAALNDARNWGGQLAAAERGMVTLREAHEASAIALHPLGTLSVKQTVVPLDLDIARFGNATPAGVRRFSIASVTVNDSPAAFERVFDFFAPSQYLELSDEEKLAAPSFEQMAAGVSVGLPGVQFTGNDEDILEDGSIIYETILVDEDERRAGPPAPVDAAFVNRYLSLGAAAASTLRRVGDAKYKVETGKNAVLQSGWTIVSREDGSPQAVAGVEPGAPTSYAASYQALTTLARTDPARAKTLMLVRATVPAA